MDNVNPESDQDQRDRNLEQFLVILHVEYIDGFSDGDVNEAAASFKNPNKDDSRRLFHNLIFDLCLGPRKLPNLQQIFESFTPVNYKVWKNSWITSIVVFHHQEVPVFTSFCNFFHSFTSCPQWPIQC